MAHQAPTPLQKNFADMDVENDGTRHVEERIEIVEDQDQIKDGVVLLMAETRKADGEAGVNANIKFANDGKTILVPQPSGNPEDPLNWSSFKKHSILLMVSFGAFCGDFGAAGGIPAIGLMSAEWNISILLANSPNNISALMCGVSGVLFMPLLNSWGRIPVLFWTTLIGAGFTLAVCLTHDFNAFFAMRTLQGLFQSAGQTIGLAFVEDMFFYHQHARKIGIWYSIFITSPFLSPLLGNFIVAKTGTWRPIFWCNFAVAATLTLVIFFFGDETYYRRSIPVEQQRKRPSSQRLLRVLGVWQLRERRGNFPTVMHTYMRLLEVFCKPVIPPTMLAYSIVFMWFIGITTSSSILLSTPESLGGYGLSTLSLGYCFFTPIVAVCLGELIGHFFNDAMANHYTKTHRGRFMPEVRLRSTYIGAILMVPGLVVIGQALAHHLTIGAIIMGWGMYTTGIMITSVATVAWALSCHPSASGEVSALINFGRVACGFSVSYFQQQWGTTEGFDVSFGIQAATTVVAFLIFGFLQVFGPRLRAWAGPVSHIIV
ncbi:hypothetical protein, variant [Exophiala oligosperma]|uniref:Major facilitator superfamily (MFS) profile domain-containing protein n=1 Tax=Exophiala oligosperma TaxID=215243 RepID=A0A0D2B4V7_9EURO|nr:uncharacterized protein PV06_00003 [Exophiala oligosperma]XP_016267507.1 hypothetical protein, variant [Exophiala oligosperma]KIW47290.1 hypothetical protein PV06_00003 [Exophiala oligosperma]KIW47291.1 hypothetical protein, variant [Exophiala oligosperma]